VELAQLARSLQITTPTVIDRRYNLCSICGWKLFVIENSSGGNGGKGLFA
jgi:hypothetical protein